jgi:hypothetical protein
MVSLYSYLRDLCNEWKIIGDKMIKTIVFLMETFFIGDKVKGRTTPNKSSRTPCKLPDLYIIRFPTSRSINEYKIIHGSLTKKKFSQWEHFTLFADILYSCSTRHNSAENG